ncbi:bifunctional hydroxymethylpyrimidine kinase/phosphomethylpyrimidine kinase [Permianibacter aggregans]|uniref:hydroxymethylpyrimidine kinase n=1 Tax=Permianibacter aggregans TaxID=1510150 RepID=A0A4R6UL00_9GAMM|nr:hydroxymethylpyrimidine/phosphomethylpyrimidine kinase [Permianibacter aggregans]QGX39226.1 hydroxymethylpyrimidine/phosphomethylpyrimidine kinase [Permianibacter aggregans]TDQ46033.1 hydroxymethylpyrimidine/phosphomethylpyrimidine kinase [Permianibacter aggregans]
MPGPVPPVVLCFSGSDPSGGAGISADIEALASLGCHCAPVITVLTVQDSTNVSDLDPVDPDFIKAQANAVLRDMNVAVIKVGLLGNPAVVSTVAEICGNYPNIPLVVDPVLAAGGGAPLADDVFIRTLKKELLPLATLVTPNAREAHMLFPDADTLDQCAEELLDLGCEHVLITGADEPTPVVHNTLYSSEYETETFHWERLPAMYHGSGCTLAASCAGLIAQGLSLFDAVNEAQEYTFNALKDGQALGQGQLFPNRFFWAQSRDTEEGESDESDKDTAE